MEANRRLCLGPVHVRPTFRIKLLGIVGVAASFAVLITLSAASSTRIEDQLRTIRDRHVPRLEQGPRLNHQFEPLRLAMQDAVAAQDRTALEDTRSARDEFLHQLRRLAQRRGRERARDGIPGRLRRGTRRFAAHDRRRIRRSTRQPDERDASAAAASDGAPAPRYGVRPARAGTSVSGSLRSRNARGAATLAVELGLPRDRARAHAVDEPRHGPLSRRVLALLQAENEVRT
jgi:hypothetical protein